MLPIYALELYISENEIKDLRSIIDIREHGISDVECMVEQLIAIYIDKEYWKCLNTPQ